MTPEELDKYAEPTRPNTRREILEGILHEDAEKELSDNGGEMPSPLERYVCAVIGDECGLLAILSSPTLPALAEQMATVDALTDELSAYDLDEDGKALSFAISFNFGDYPAKSEPTDAAVQDLASIRATRIEERLSGTVALTGNEYQIPRDPGRYLIEEKNNGDTVWAMNADTLDEAADLINMSETERSGVIIFDLDFTDEDKAELIPSITVTSIYGTDWKPSTPDPVDDASQQPSKCDNCGKVWKDYQLDPSKHLHERMDEGGPMPSGDCPECGAFCYPVEEKQ